MSNNLKSLRVTGKGEVTTEPVYRSRIKENFTFEQLKQIYSITQNIEMNTNDKADMIKFIVRDFGFVELGPGSNRYAMLKDNYVFKFALDMYGYRDNNVEFEMAQKLQPYVTKTYETNGLISVAEYVNVISKNEFAKNKEVIRGILSVLAESYLFEDLGCIEKNFRNWGFNDKDELIILDYGYIFERDDILMRCTHCHSRLWYNANFDTIVCSKSSCRKKYKIHDIKEMMECSDSKRSKLFEKKREVVIDFENDEAANIASERISKQRSRMA